MSRSRSIQPHQLDLVWRWAGSGQGWGASYGLPLITLDSSDWNRKFAAPLCFSVQLHNQLQRSHEPVLHRI